ncbi:NAD(P)-binding protein [Acaromyces ingoldii]|uniref:NAD(P)-binding protein n=1 Tax=Acaromyces ingoldii TaxID=215250 RepID=A0A316YI44_9BASI|nr:NAD(P)-binding protein [Acaromyces ingoldii]PWN88841.1 NAD(P)-binding protein [Acaromyces ingoldii]
MSAPVVLITGCSGNGIGYHLGLAFQRAGCRVFVSARNMDKLEKSGFPSGVRLVKLDVVDSASVQSAVAQVEEEAGHIDILVNNAGQGCVGPLAEVEMSRAKQTFDTNVFGLLNVTQAVSKGMIARRKGKIINISSIVSFVPTPWAGIYCATKAAVTSLSDVLRMELRGFGIDVVCVFPGAIQSSIGLANASSFRLDPASAYSPLADKIAARGSWSQHPRSTPASDLAQQIVQAALQTPSTGYLTAGYRSTRAWLSYYLPHWAKDYFWGRQFGIEQVGKP